MKRGEPRDPIGAAFAIALLILLALTIWPAVAEAPPRVTIKPAAVCDGDKCVMKLADFEALQKFHAERMEALLQAAELIDGLAQQNQALLNQMARDAAGRKGRRI